MKVEAWLVLEGERQQYGGTYPQGHPYEGQRRIGTIKIKGTYQSKPNLTQEQIAFKIELDVDEGWFLDQGSPTIKAGLPAPPPDMAQDIPVTVDMPIKPRGKSSAASVVQRP